MDENKVSILGSNLKMVINHDRLTVAEAARMTKIHKLRMINITKKSIVEITKEELQRIKLFLSISPQLLEKENLTIREIEEYRNQIRHMR